MNRSHTRILALALLLFAFGCSEEGPDTVVRPDAGVCPTVLCNGVCCAEGESCQDGACKPTGCVPDCEERGKECGDNGCGTGTCGTCPEGFHCEGFKCVCPPEDEKAFCERLEKECGMVTALDECGEERTVNCGSCEWPSECVGNICTCVPKTREEFCEGLGIECGPADGVDCGMPRHEDECGPCASDNEACSDTGQCYECNSPKPEEFCAAHGRTCGPLSGVDECGRERNIESCGECPNNDCSPNGRCGTHDTCQNPTEVVLDEEGKASFAVDTSQALGNDADGTCYQPSSSGGKDFVYHFTLTERRDVDITASGSGWNAHLHLRTECDDVGTELGCAYASKAVAQLSFRALPAGTYYLWVDTYVSDAAPGTVDIVTRPPEPGPPNDTCDNAQVVEFADGRWGVSGDTTGAANDLVGSCSTTQGTRSTGADLVYVVELNAPAALAATLKRVPAGGPFVQVLHLRTDCDDPGTELGCSIGSGIPSIVSSPELPAGHYYIVVDGLSTSANGAHVSSGGFELNVLTAPVPLHDTCAGAMPLIIDWESGTASIRDNTIFARDDTDLDCDATTGRDLVYAFEIPAGMLKDVTATVTAVPGGLEPAVAIRRDCTDAATDLACSTGISGNVRAATAQLLSAGTYYVWVDGVADYKYGEFELTLVAVDSVPPPDNDSCDFAKPISLDPTTRLYTEIGYTTSAANDYAGSCEKSGYQHNGGDVVYALTLDSSQYVGITVYSEEMDASYRPAVYVRSTCADRASEVAAGCDLDDRLSAPSGVASLKDLLLPKGTHYIVVDGVNGSAGDFRLDVVAYTKPPPLQLYCSDAALPVTLDAQGKAVVTGTNCGGYSPSSDYPTCSTASGPAAVYYFELASTKTLTVDLRAGHGDYDSVVYLRRECSSQASEVLCSVRLARHSFDAQNLEAGVYYLFVDSTVNACGGFVLELSAADPQTAPGHDTCAEPKPLAFDGNVATVHDDTRRHYPSGDGYCAPGSGPDLVYSFELQEPKLVTARVVAEDPNMRPVVYVRPSCASPLVEPFCKAASAAGGTATAGPVRLEKGTWYLWVDSYEAAYAGAFALTVTLSELTGTPPANDVCAGAELVTLGATPVVKTGTTANAFDHGRGTCGLLGTTHSGPDVVYYFRVEESASVTAKVTRTQGTTYKVATYIRAACDSPALADEPACAVGDSVAEATATLLPGTYYVFVDGQDSTSGEYRLELSKGPPVAGESCFNPERVVFASDQFTSTTDTSLAAPHAHGTCNPSSGADVVYWLALETDKRIDFTLSASQNKGVNVYIRRESCHDPAAEIFCLSVTDDSVSQKLNRLPAGAYYLWVDSRYASTQSPVTLSLAQSDPPPLPDNDTCRAPLPFPLDPVTGFGEVVSTTAGAYHDYSGTCTGSGTTAAPHDGPDVVYAVPVPAGSTLIAQVEAAPDATDFFPVIYLRRQCASGAAEDEVACAGNSTGVARKAFTVTDLEEGTYYLVVDGATAKKSNVETRRSFGGFTLQVAVRPGVTNNTCSTVDALEFDASGVARVYSDTSLASNEAKGTCDSSDAGKADLVYSVNLRGTSDLAVEVVPLEGMRPFVYLRSACNDAASELPNGCVAAAAGTTARLFFPRLAGGLYYLWVDSSTHGPFRLTVSSTEPKPSPANDTCSGATHIRLEQAAARWEGKLEGEETTYASDDYQGTAPCNAAGYDLAYYFTLNEAAGVTVEVSPTGDKALKPVVYLRSQCDLADPANQLDCKDKPPTGQTAVKVGPKSLPPGTYYVIVDSVAPSYGTFDITVTATPLPPGDACFNALFIDPESTLGVPVLLSGDSSLAVNDFQGSCATASGGDFVYYFQTRTVGDLVVVAERDADTSSTWKPLVYLRTECTASTDVACAQNSGNPPDYSVPSTLVYRDLPAGTYYLILDANTSSGSGKFKASVTFSGQSPPVAGDNCSNAIELTVPVPGSAAVETDTTLAHDDFHGKCESALHLHAGGDLVYFFNLAKPAQVKVTLTGHAMNSKGASSYWEAVYLRDACDSVPPAREFGCDDETGIISAAKFENAIVPAGTVYLFVDGAENTVGKASLSIETLELMPGDDCPIAEPLAFIGDKAQASGTTVGANSSTYSMCITSDPKAPDVVYALSLRNDRAATIELKGTGFYPAFELRTDCATRSAANAMMCASASGDTASLSVGRLPQGEYYLWVDGANAASGAFDLSVTLGDIVPPPNDNCGGAIPDVGLTGAGTVTVYGDTSAAANDTTGTCVDSSSGEVIYRLTVPGTERMKLTARVERDTAARFGSLVPQVYLRRTCDRAVAEEEVGCRPNATSSSDNTTLTLNAVPPGTYFLFVDGAGQSFGRFKLTVTLATMPPDTPVNENCFEPTELTFTGNVASGQGTLTNSVDDARGSCGDASKNDVVFRFDLDDAYGITAKVTPAATANIQPLIFVRSDCGSRLASREKGCAAAPEAKAPAQLDIKYLPKGTYFLWVEILGINYGAFTVEVVKREPILPPLNDTCDVAPALTLGTVVSDDTSLAVDDYGSALPASCGASNTTAAGPDVVYSYTPAADGAFRVSLKPKTDWNAYLWVTTGTCGGDGLACLKSANAAGVGGTEQVVVAGTAGTLYYIVVDGLARTDAGAFDLWVEAVPEP